MQQLTLTPIGIIHTPYQEKYHAPRQPNVTSQKIIGTIELYAHKNYEQALEDLDGFEYVWLIFWFHKNSDWKPKVLPPRGGRMKRGVFATRSPHRPNPIGISLCKIIDVKGRFITVENPDVLDGTPILDIKPYLPYAESFPNAEIGWLEDVENDAQKFSVIVSALACEQGEWLKTHYDIHLLERAKNILSHDPFPHSYRRIMKHENGYIIAMKSWRLLYSITEQTVSINSILSGYEHDVLLENSDLHHQQAHIEFHKMWMMDRR
ncbi:MAG: tRNA (N6-threonylcarbamoyladenosine(37)-N6)-methyltransferase TrmO [Bacteroidetes bacterium]|nr:tRNA (N6-threonylcarbamoyladenosine(37)-N6)-methyltransferase TrmO [Bacteroidota bacterium]